MRRPSVGDLLRGVGDRFVLDRRQVVPALKRRRIPGFHILIYHRVSPERRPLMFDTSPLESFERQMAYLSRHYRVLSLGQALDAIDEDRLPPGVVCVTFDDGYRDFEDYALPILRRYGIPATVFLATAGIGTGTLLWYDQIVTALRTTTARRLDSPLDGRRVSLASETDKHDAACHLLDGFKRVSDADRIRGVRQVLSALDVKEAEDRGLMLDWDAVRRMQRQGIEFGSHSETHPILSRQSAADVWKELTASKAALEAECQRPATLFAYPNGKPEDYSPSIIESVKRAGYRCAVTSEFGTNRAGDDRYRLKRGTPWEDSVIRFGMKLAWYRMQEHAVPDAAR